MSFELAYNDAYQRGVYWVESLRCESAVGSSHYHDSATASRGVGEGGGEYHEAQVAPLIEEIAVHIYAIGLAQILGDEGPYGGEVLLLEAMLILDIPQLRRQAGYSRQLDRAARDGRHV